MVSSAAESTPDPVPFPELSPHSCRMRMSGCSDAMMRTRPFQLLNSSVLGFVLQIPSCTFHVMMRMSVWFDLSQSPLSGSHWAVAELVMDARMEAAMIELYCIGSLLRFDDYRNMPHHLPYSQSGCLFGRVIVVL